MLLPPTGPSGRTSQPVVALKHSPSVFCCDVQLHSASIRSVYAQEQTAACRCVITCNVALTGIMSPHGVIGCTACRALHKHYATHTSFCTTAGESSVRPMKRRSTSTSSTRQNVPQTTNTSTELRLETRIFHFNTSECGRADGSLSQQTNCRCTCKTFSSLLLEMSENTKRRKDRERG